MYTPRISKAIIGFLTISNLQTRFLTLSFCSFTRDFSTLLLVVKYTHTHIARRRRTYLYRALGRSGLRHCHRHFSFRRNVIIIRTGDAHRWHTGVLETENQRTTTIIVFLLLIFPLALNRVRRAVITTFLYTRNACRPSLTDVEIRIL